MANLSSLLRTLVTANHILHHNSVVDAYGHISVRDPTDSSLFHMSGNRAPALVSSSADFVTYYVENASAVAPDAPRGYIERYIHSEMFKRFSDVDCVIHAHAPDVLPYAISGAPLLPVFHLPGFLGTEIPVWDIETVYNSSDQHDLLVRSEQLGADLASHFAAPDNRSTASSAVPDYKIVLMRKHGFTTFGPDIKTAVFRAVFTTVNAQVETNAALLRNAFAELVDAGLDVTIWGGDSANSLMKNDFAPLTPEQAAAAEASNDGTIDRPWDLWTAEVEANSLYQNNV